MPRRVAAAFANAGRMHVSIRRSHVKEIETLHGYTKSSMSHKRYEGIDVIPCFVLLYSALFLVN